MNLHAAGDRQILLIYEAAEIGFACRVASTSFEEAWSDADVTQQVLSDILCS